MNKEIKKLEDCLKTMKKCLKIPNVENCVCFSDAFKVFNLEADELTKKTEQIGELKSKEKVISIKKEIEEMGKIISKGDKECVGCSPCAASLVFKTYAHILDKIYLNDEL